MNSNDLFSFLDDTAQEEPEVIANGHADSTDAMDADKTSPEEPQQHEVPTKRKVDETRVEAEVHENGDVHMSHTEDEPGPSTKKPRMASPKPVVLDSVEIEAKREVAASAGLTGNVEASGSRLELRHQVRFSHRAAFCWACSQPVLFSS